MCGIFASTDPASCLSSAMLAARRGVHGWGVCLAIDDKFLFSYHQHNPQSDMKSKLAALIATHKPRSLIGHCRLGTTGRLDAASLQPCEGRGFAMVHNGILPFWPETKHASDSWYLASEMEHADDLVTMDKLTAGEPYAIISMTRDGQLWARQRDQTLVVDGPHIHS